MLGYNGLLKQIHYNRNYKSNLLVLKHLVVKALQFQYSRILKAKVPLVSAVDRSMLLKDSNFARSQAGYIRRRTGDQVLYINPFSRGLNLLGFHVQRAGGCGYLRDFGLAQGPVGEWICF